MRALFISNNFPADPAVAIHGIFQRLSMLVEGCLDVVDQLDLLFFVPPAIDASPAGTAQYQARLQAVWGPRIRVLLVPHARNPNFTSNWDRYGAGIFDVYRQENYFPTSGPAQVEALAQCLASKPDWVFAHRLATMLPLMRAKPECPVIFDMDDIEHRSHVRRVSTFPRWPGERLTLLHTPALKSAELRAVRAARCTFVCSQPDRAYLAAAARTERLAIVNNCVPAPKTEPRSCSAPHLLFIGTFEYAPNVQAVNVLLAEIWPLIRRQVPEARLRIVGANQKALAHFAAPPEGVDFMGFVPDLDAVYADTRLVCAPIYSGAGTRIKIIEAASYAKAVVSTRIGAEGLEFEDGVAINLRDHHAAFAAACVAQLRDDAANQAMGKAARQTFLEKYERSAIIRHVSACLSASLGIRRDEPLAAAQTAGD